MSDPRLGAMLSDTAILAAMHARQIVIEGLRPDAVGSNSVDLHLGRWLLVYDTPVVDARADNPTRAILIPEGGLLLKPGRLYLGVTQEYTESHGLTPWLDGKSSTGRLGLSVHQTAGRGDVGFCGHWTLEINVQACPVSLWQRLWTRSPHIPRWQRPFHPGGVVVHAGMPIAQCTFFAMSGHVATPYSAKRSAKYASGRQVDPRPVASKMWQNFTPRPPDDVGDGHALAG